MTRPVNLYLLSRIPGEAAFNHVYRHASGKLWTGKTPIHEIISLRTFADGMVSEGLPLPALDGFFFGYKIPQIGKEFDLLKFGSDGLLSIELKSQPVPLAQIRAQLLRNRHYLSHLGRDLHLFTFVSDTGQCYRLDGDVLSPVSITDIAKAVQSFAGDYLSEIDGLFRPSEYIVSPAGTPEKFLQHEYFLTQAQDQIQKNLLAALGETTGLAWFSLTGKPGTGKTLLLYDIGRSLAEEARTAILHWGELAEGHRIINAAETGLTILPWEVMDGSEDCLTALAPYSYLLVDESHRLTPRQFEIICSTARTYRQRIVFCLDPEQILTTAERKNDIAGRIEALPPAESFTLSEHLRGNRQLQSFIQEVRDLNSKPKAPIAYTDVDLGFARTIDEARSQLAYYRDKGYIFINYYRNARKQPASGEISAPASDLADQPDASANMPINPLADQPDASANMPINPLADQPDASAGMPVNPFAEFEGGYDIHHVIGQEFDRVVLLLDNSFHYSEDGKLEGIPSPDPDFLYPNLFYQSVTRVQEKLALIVLENEPLFDAIAEILR